MSNDTPEREPFDPTRPHDVVIPAADADPDADPDATPEDLEGTPEAGEPE